MQDNKKGSVKIIKQPEAEKNVLELPLKTDFTGKVVVVTGAGGVLCGDMARAFAQAGAKVAALDLNEDKVKKLAEELKNEGFVCEGYAANVLEAEQAKAVHARILEDLGKCDILINGAGGNNKRATTDNEYQHEAKAGQTTFFDLDTEAGGFCIPAEFSGNVDSDTDFCAGYGREAVGKYFKYFFDECVYTADQNSGIFRRESGGQQFYPVACHTFCGKQNPL